MDKDTEEHVETDETELDEDVEDQEDEETEDESDDDAGEGDEGDGEGDEPAASAKTEPETRGSKRIQALAREAKEAREEARKEREERIRAEERAKVAAPRDDGAAARARQEKLDLMEPAERTAFLQGEKLEQMEGRILLSQLRTEDAMDKGSYQTKAASNKIYSKNAAEVERRLTAERQAGRNWPRETILAQIIGESALKGPPQTKEKERAQQRVKTSKGTPPSGRSNVSQRSNRGNESFEELESRLENQVF